MADEVYRTVIAAAIALPSEGPDTVVIDADDVTMLDPKQLAARVATAKSAGALQSFVDGPGSVETLNAAIDTVVPALGDRVTAEAVEEMRAAIESRISEIRAKLPTTTSCDAASTSEVP